MRAGRGVNGRLIFNRCGVSVGEGEKALEMGHGDGCMSIMP